MILQKELEKQGNWLFQRRSLLPLVMLVIGIVILYMTFGCFSVMHPFLMLHWHTFEWSCLVIGLIGVAVRAYTVGFTPVGTSGRNTAGQVADSLNTTGIYSVLRHPLYVGNFLMWLSVSLLACSVGFIVSFVLAYWLYYERIMYAEEQFLSHKFGKEYRDWAMRTPAIIPNLKHFKSSSLSFSWKKVLKKEKNGVFALFLLFSIFDSLSANLSHSLSCNIPLLLMAVVSGVAYLVLKYIKKYTSLLDEQGR